MKIVHLQKVRENCCQTQKRSLDNIRLKFIGHLGKFDNLEDFDTPFGEFHSKMNNY